ncbi:hypothetical protein NSMM_50012 [Nitrosomonas mobilis]|uniref:Uncharacterized protein n=1 Tax=Nitrosomonas mobilis TaxID=51642 RepID=A0A1G5SGR8_9PROT|nr:hypothetical protein NSMM_50012 [Nitrosomonas mobilis]
MAARLPLRRQAENISPWYLSCEVSLTDVRVKRVDAESYCHLALTHPRPGNWQR